MTELVRPIAPAARVPQSQLVVAFDGSAKTPVQLTRNQVASSSDAVLQQTVANASEVMRFLKSRFGRDGLDGRGQKLEIIVHAPEPPMWGGGPMNNAYWDLLRNRMFIGDGDGKLFSPLGLAKDVIAHEAGHAVLASEVKMNLKGQSGALHESFGDVLGVLVDGDDWQIGEEVLTPSKPGDAIRELGKPEKYDHMSRVPAYASEPHDLADIPNLAAYRIAEKIGRRDMGKVWYEGFTAYMKDYAQFTDAAQATIEAATKLYGADSKQATAVSDAWKSVGVLQATAPAA